MRLLFFRLFLTNRRYEGTLDEGMEIWLFLERESLCDFYTLYIKIVQ